MKIVYIPRKFKGLQLRLIDMADEIIVDYLRDGYNLTLRQLYYQFVRRDWLPEEWYCEKAGSTNNVKSYKKLGDLLSNARDAGLVDWLAIVDRSRGSVGFPSWDSPKSIVRACADQYQIDLWEDQPYDVSVWVEKDALSDIIEKGCEGARTRYMACKGYLSASAAWRAGQAAMRASRQGKIPVFIHLGDHDPSGIDMSRDNAERISLYSGLSRGEFIFKRIALTIDQVREYDPPPNPAKPKDSRSPEYIERYGRQCWELDALEPRVLVDLVQSEIDKYIDKKLWEASLEEERSQKAELVDVADNWEHILSQM